MPALIKAMPRPQINLIAAIDSRRAIAVGNAIPWAKEPWAGLDRRMFREQTTGGVIVMGRTTFEQCGMLPGRITIIVSRACRTAPRCVPSLSAAIELAGQLAPAATIWVCGGAQLYREALCHPCCKLLVLTHVPGEWGQASAVFPRYKSKSAPYAVTALGPCRCEVRTVLHTNHDEQAFMALFHRIAAGPILPNRTGVPAKTLIGEQLKFDLGSASGRILPLLTTKRVFWPAVYWELMWFLRGCRGVDGNTPDTSYLHAHNVHIWDKNTTAEALAARGLALQPGQTGPIYGHQWRKGRDQLASVIATLRTDPYRRDLVISAWSSEEIAEMALPPCHFAFQFLYDGRLHCVVSQRSGDYALGVPFNIASYALLTHLVSLVTGLPPGTLTLDIASAHLYTDHDVATWLTRQPVPFPTLAFSDRVHPDTIDDFHTKYDIADLLVRDYWPDGPIKLDMAV
jgi:thymidylate synthase